MQRKARQIDGDSSDIGRLHASSSGAPLGQNQPTSATRIGTDPQTTAQGEKIDETSMMLVVTAATSGQIESDGDVSRACGRASATVVTSNSRRPILRPVATGSSPRVAHSGLASVTIGIRAKL